MKTSLRAADVALFADFMATPVLIEHARSLGITITLCRECSLPTFRPRYCSDKCSNRARQRDHYGRKRFKKKMVRWSPEVSVDSGRVLDVVNYTDAFGVTVVTAKENKRAVR